MGKAEVDTDQGRKTDDDKASSTIAGETELQEEAANTTKGNDQKATEAEEISHATKSAERSQAEQITEEVKPEPKEEEEPEAEQQH